MADNPDDIIRNFFIQQRGIKPPEAAPPQVGQTPPGLPPGARTPSLSATEQQSQAEYAQARQAAGSFYDRVYPLQQAIPLLKQLGEGGTGPGSQRLQEMFSGYLTMAPDQFKKIWKPDPEQVAKFDEVRKYLNQYAQAKANQANVGPHTNAGLETTQSANPSVDISNLASSRLATNELALQRMNHAAFLNSLQQGINPQEWSDYLPKYKAGVDSRAYQLDVLSDADRAKLLDEVGQADATKQKQFMDSVNFGERNRLLDLPVNRP